MARGPLPPGSFASSVSSGAAGGFEFVFGLLKTAYQGLPAIARVGIARKLQAWATNEEAKALREMQPPATAPEDFRAHAYDTTGHTRP